MQSEYIVVDFDSIAIETEKAYGIEWDDIDDIIWFPKSQCTIDIETKTIEVAEWIWLQKQKEYNL